MIGVVILNYFSAANTIELYSSLLSGIGHELQVLVVDNSCDKSEHDMLLEKIPEEMLIRNTSNSGYAGGNNLGISFFLLKRDVEFIALLNPDVRTDPAVLWHLEKHFNHNPKLAAIGPRLCLKQDKDVIFSDGGLLHLNGFYYPGHLHAKQSASKIGSTGVVTDIGYVNGSFFLIRTAALREIGLLNEKFFLYFEETEWCFRACKKGWSIATDTDVVAYQDISNNGAVYDYYMLRNQFLFHHLHYRKGLLRLTLHHLKRIVITLTKRPASLNEKWNFLKLSTSAIFSGLRNV